MKNVSATVYLIKRGDEKYSDNQMVPKRGKK
jgi:hypothetical protein